MRITNFIKNIEKNFVSLNIKHPTEIKFIEDKLTNTERITDLFRLSMKFNHWANQGPLWNLLSQCYLRYLKNLKNKVVIPCANGGLGLTALIKLHNIKQEKKLRWVISSFGFANTNRGELFNAQIIDCDENGLFSLNNLAELKLNSYDGIIVTNPFGSINNFSEYSEWAKKNDKVLLIDNAAGINKNIPDIPYQSFSLHHTKPFGFGEGGFVIIPESEKELFLKLIEYTPIKNLEKKFWLNNSKISDISCAYLIERLENTEEWVPRYLAQTKRVIKIAAEHDLEPLVDKLDKKIPFMSIAFVSSNKIDLESFRNEKIAFGKYYQPIKNLNNAKNIYDRVINIPTHPNVSKISDTRLHQILDIGLSQAKK